MKKFMKLFVALNHYFTAPSVKPETKYLPINKNNTITGKLAKTAPDNKNPQSIWYWPIIPAKPTGKVFNSSPLINIEANKYSVQDIIKQKIDTLAIPNGSYIIFMYL